MHKQLKINFEVTLLTFYKMLFCKTFFIAWQRWKSKCCYISVYVFYTENLLIILRYSAGDFQNSPLNTSTTALVHYLLLNSELQLGKSKESTNQHIKVQAKLFFFCNQKQQKSRHGSV